MGEFDFLENMKDEEELLFKRCIRKLLDATFIIEDRDERLYQYLSVESNCYDVSAFLRKIGYDVVVEDKLKVAMLVQNEADLEKSFINRLMTYMTEHIDGDLSLCTLSEKLHLNPSYLSRRFKELTGKNLTEAILEIRMETACHLLRTTSFRISEIAQMVGYETAANFSRVFKKSMKVTPREFRDEEGIIQ